MTIQPRDNQMTNSSTAAAARNAAIVLYADYLIDLDELIYVDADITRSDADVDAAYRRAYAAYDTAVAAVSALGTAVNNDDVYDDAKALNASVRRMVA